MNQLPLPKLGLTRNVIRRNYALISRDGYVASSLPGWTKCVPHVLISRGLGARLVQIVAEFEKGGRAVSDTGSDEWFFYLIAGRATLNKTALTAGSFALVPPGFAIDFASTAKDTSVLIFQKTYEPLVGTKAPAFLSGHADDAPEAPFLGDPRARLKTLIADGFEHDLAVNIFTFDPGTTLPFVETHIMEHGMLFLDGSGVYRLGDNWHPVQAGDALWIAPYCPQWFIAAGPDPARYIYYKNVNRPPL